MWNRIWVLAVASVLAMTMAVAAAPLDKKQASALQRIAGEIGNNEASLAKLGEGTKPPPSERVEADYRRKLDKIAQKLAELPADSAEVKAVRARLAKLEALLASKVALRGHFVNPAEMARLADGLDDLDTKLATYGAGKQWGIINERVESEVGGQLARVEEALAGLPVDHADVKKVRAHLAQARATLAAKVAERMAKVKAGADAEAAIVALITGPAFEADLQTLTAMKGMFAHHGWYEPDHYHFGRWVDHEDVVAMKAWGEGWAQTQKDWVTLRARYAPAVTAGLLRGQPGFAQIKIKDVAGDDTQEDFEAFTAAIATFVKGAPAQVEADGKELLVAIAAAGTKGDFGPVLDPGGRIQTLRHRLVNVTSAYAPLAAPADRARVEASAKTAEASAVKLIAEVADKIVTANRAPEDRYQGKERKALAAFVTKVWQKHFSTEQILAIRLRDANFERQEESIKDPTTGSQSKRDQSRLLVTVVVGGTAKEAILWTAVIVRDHMKGDTLELVAVDRSAKGPTPMQRMLRANL